MLWGSTTALLKGSPRFNFGGNLRAIQNGGGLKCPQKRRFGGQQRAARSKNSANAKKPEMESVGSYLPKGAARHAMGGENFVEFEDGRTDGRIKGVWTESFFEKKNFPEKNQVHSARGTVPKAARTDVEKQSSRLQSGAFASV